MQAAFSIAVIAVFWSCVCMREMPTAAYEKIGKYEVKRIIRSTGSSDLYECFDPDLKVRAAVKIFDVKKRLLDKLPYSMESWHNRFMREARLLAQIDHPHVIGVRELSYIEGKPFYVMPYVETSLLYEMGKDGGIRGYAPELDGAPGPRKLPVARAVEIMFQLSSALAAFHGRGLVHRDIKPGNVLLTKLHTGLVKLCDPGMVKYPDFEESQAGYWIGTREYLPPEQKRSATDVDARADVYAVAVLGYRMMTGRLPEGAFTPLKEEVAEVSDNLHNLVMSAMSPKPEDRPKNALELLKGLALIRAQIRQSGGGNG